MQEGNAWNMTCPTTSFIDKETFFVYNLYLHMNLYDLYTLYLHPLHNHSGLSYTFILNKAALHSIHTFSVEEILYIYINANIDDSKHE